MAIAPIIGSLFANCNGRNGIVPFQFHMLYTKKILLNHPSFPLSLHFVTASVPVLVISTIRIVLNVSRNI